MRKVYNLKFHCVTLHKPDFDQFSFMILSRSEHYDNRRNINLMEPKKAQRNCDREYRVTMKRFMLGK